MGLFSSCRAMKRFSYSLTEDDFRTQRDEFFGLLRLKGREDRYKRFLALAVSVIFWIFLFQAYVTAEPWTFLDASRNYLTILIYSILLLSLFYLGRWARSEKYLAFLKGAIGDINFGVHEHGIHIWTGKGKKYLTWPELVAIHETSHNIFFQYGPHQALFLPTRVFQSEQEKSEFIAELKALWLNDPGNIHKTSLPDTFQTKTSLLTKEIDALSINLRSSLKLIFFLGTEFKSFRVSYWQAWMLCLIGFVVSLAGDYLLTLPEPVFSSYGLVTFFSYLLFGALASILVSIRLGAKEMALSVFVVMAAADFWISVLLYLLYYIGGIVGAEWNHSLQWAVYLVLAVWWLFILFRVLRFVYLLPPPSALHYSSVMLMVSMVVPLYLPHSDFYFAGQEREEEDYRPKYSVEDVYYKQGELMSQALSAVTPGRAGKPELYLLAFAGYGDEKVFTNEVNFVKNEFDKSYGTEGHSVVLGNNPDTIETRPLANIHNLNSALADISRKMNVEEDVLFLFMTSHGSQESGLSVDLDYMGMKDISPDILRKALDDSGIKNRVVVVSSCYSGIFIDPLKGPNTLIISASAKDKTSFGCGDKTEFTYFGEAYFKHALVKQSSFIDAFDVALQEIRQREKTEGIKASEPQIHVGSEIREKLNRMRQRS